MYFPAAAIVAISIAVPHLATASPWCSTPERIATFRKPLPFRTPAPRATGGPQAKTNRDAFGERYNTRSSVNFALRWQSAPVTEAQAQFALDELERAWAVYNEESTGT